MIKHTLRGLGLVLFCLAMEPSAAQAQSALLRPFDGASIGGGLNIYQGDLDGNPDSDLIKYIGGANLHVLAGVDRRYGRFGAGLDFNYHRFTARSSYVDMANNVMSLDLVGSFGVDNRGLFRLYTGIGPTFLIPRYYRFPENREGYEDPGPRFVATVPVGIIFQDRIRLGIRITSTDLLEGFRGNSGSRDYLSFINLGYRFDLSN